MTDWPACRRFFAESIGPGRMDPRVWNFLEDLPEGQPVLVACSGGADSVFLTLWAAAWLPPAGHPVAVLHFDHGLRGEAAQSDARFVRELAEALGLPFREGRPEEPVQPDEDALRSVRFGWMERCYRESGAGGLLLGHHADDLLESLLLALLSGSGPAGLAAPQPVKPFSDGHVRLRPLLSWKRRDIEARLLAAGASWREDASNQDTVYLRNWLRQVLIPQLHERVPRDLHAAARRTRELMESCVRMIDQQVNALELDWSDPGRLSCRNLMGQPAPVIRRAIRAWWLQHHPANRLGRGVLDPLVEALEAGQSGISFPLSPELCLHLDPQENLLLLDHREPGSSWKRACRWHWPAGPLFLADGSRLQADRVTWPDGETPWAGSNPQRHAWLDLEDPHLIVRGWEPGDRYQPLGAPGRKKLQDAFVDAGWSRHQKHSRPFVCRESGEILWVPGLAPAEAHRIRGPVNSALRLTYLSG